MKKDFTWVNPENRPDLTNRDRADLAHIKELLEKGDMTGAMFHARYNCDTVIREEIPPSVWLIMGGTLLPVGERKPKEQEGTIFFEGQEKYMTKRQNNVIHTDKK